MDLVEVVSSVVEIFGLVVYTAVMVVSSVVDGVDDVDGVVVVVTVVTTVVVVSVLVASVNIREGGMYFRKMDNFYK